MFSFRISSRREKEKEGLKAETFLVLLRAGRAMNALMKKKERERGKENKESKRRKKGKENMLEEISAQRLKAVNDP